VADAVSGSQAGQPRMAWRYRQKKPGLGRVSVYLLAVDQVRP
jgi:hypothetical protein